MDETSPLPGPLAYRFGHCRLVPAQRLLLAAGEPIKLGGRAFDMLLALVERRDRTVSKQELLDLVWPRLVVEENNLQVQMVALRKLLGHVAIATVPGRGYRFTLPVQVDGEAAAPPRPMVTAAPPGPEAATGARSNLPHQVPELIGRGEDLALLRRMVDEHALVTVAGSGGIGKTRLAQALAHDWRNQHAACVWWVELAPLSEPKGVAAAVAQALQAPQGSHRDATQATLAALGSDPALLVLDNAEHLVDGAASFVQQLLAQAPQVRIVVTSQEVLRLPAEHVLRLSTLALPGDDSLAAASDSGAVALFVARARAADARFELSADNQSLVADVCRQLDGVPLAIELAAARMPLLGLQGLRDRLGERFRVLTAGSRAVMRRHQTLRATLQWSHALLTRNEQRVFRRLGVFTGGFTLAAAHALCDGLGDGSGGNGNPGSAGSGDDDIDRWDVLEALGGLVDKSLVLADEQDPPRYRLLETTRLFALEQLAGHDETAAALQDHATALMQWLRTLDQAKRQRPPTAAERADWLAELPNLRCALGWLGQLADAGPAVEMLALSARIYGWAGLSAEYLQRAEQLAPRLSTQTPAAVAAAFWHGAAALGTNHGSPFVGRAALQAVQAWRTLGEPLRLYQALNYAIGWGARHGPLDGLEPLIAEAERIEQADWPAASRGNFQWARHRVLLMQGRAEEALACVLRQAELARAADSGFEHAALGSSVAGCELALGRLDEAEAHTRLALQALDQRSNGGVWLGYVLAQRAEVLWALGRAEEALDASRQAAPRLAPEGDDLPLLQPLALHAARQGRLAVAAQLLGHLDAALAALGERRTPFETRGREQLQGLLLQGLGPDVLQALLDRGAQLGRAQVLALGHAPAQAEAARPPVEPDRADPSAA